MTTEYKEINKIRKELDNLDLNLENDFKRYHQIKNFLEDIDDCLQCWNKGSTDYCEFHKKKIIKFSQTSQKEKRK